jgi:hypothetical protein
VKRSVVLAVAIALVGLSASALELRLRDGTVFEAASYTLTGSYLMVTLPGGQQVAYDVADVDLEALRAAEAATEQATAPAAVAPEVAGSRALTMPPAEAGPSGIAITDQDVKHTWQERREAEGEGGEEEDGAAPGPPPGFEQGGGVVINNLRVTPQGENRWVVEGDVVNRTALPVSSVRVQLQTIAAAGETPWSAEVAVTNLLPPDETAVFSHSFSAPKPEGAAHPDLRATVLWMQVQPPSQPKGPPASRMPGPVGPVPTPEV